jgi:hypothetical protein
LWLKMEIGTLRIQDIDRGFNKCHSILFLKKKPLTSSP